MKPLKRSHLIVPEQLKTSCSIWIDQRLWLITGEMAVLAEDTLPYQHEVRLFSEGAIAYLNLALTADRNGITRPIDGELRLPLDANSCVALGQNGQPALDALMAQARSLADGAIPHDGWDLSVAGCRLDAVSLERQRDWHVDGTFFSEPPTKAEGLVSLRLSNRQGTTVIVRSFADAPAEAVEVVAIFPGQGPGIVVPGKERTTPPPDASLEWPAGI